jgi:type III restriction enzyme
VLVRKKSLADEIAAIDVGTFKFTPIPMRVDEQASRTFKYEGFDVITLQKEMEREYSIPQPQTAQEVIGYYARRIAEQVKLPSQFAALAPKVRDFCETRLFGRTVDLGDREIVRAMATPLSHYVTVRTFVAVLAAAAIAEQEPTLVDADRLLSTCPPFPWSQLVFEARKTVFNAVPCDNDLERSFAQFLDQAPDVRAFAKIPMKFAFSIEYLDENRNLRLYHPDFVAVSADGAHFVLETKGQNTAEVAHKDHAARIWCENASALTRKRWVYVKVMQHEFKTLEPTHLNDLVALLQ